MPISRALGGRGGRTRGSDPSGSGGSHGFRRPGFTADLEHCDHGFHRHDITGVEPQLNDHGVEGCGDGDGRLVGHDLDEGILLLHLLADLDHPLHDLTLGDALADVGELELLDGHGGLLLATS
jgi:hypothetical protein